MPLSPESKYTPSPTPENDHMNGKLQGHFGTPTSTMLSISNLLNPEQLKGCEDFPSNPPPTPASTSVLSATATPELGPRPGPTIKRLKHGKQAATSAKVTSLKRVNYPPVECTAHPFGLSAEDAMELKEKHRSFLITPSGSGTQGLIRDNIKRIPYSSEKKSFFGKTGREGFETFEYTFLNPDEQASDSKGMKIAPKQRAVMWDYEIGLVRITPFFKTLGFQKTTPSKAIGANPGLRELCYSITGGSLDAQGYWIPFDCARALCLTFCYPIRWILTPVFGHSFIQECLRPGDAGYQKFKVNPELVRRAEVEAAHWRTQASRAGTPDSGYGQPIYQAAPTSAPVEESYPVPGPYDRPVFKQGSPFAEGSRYAGSAASTDVDSQALSPKSTRPKICDKAWTSINRPPTPGTPGPSQLTNSLLTQPRIQLKAVTTGWRGLHDGVTPPPQVISSPVHSSRAAGKRPVTSDDEDEDEYINSDSSQEDDDTYDEHSSDRHRGSKRAKVCREGKWATSTRQIRPQGRTSGQRMPQTTGHGAARLDDDVVEAARVLIELSRKDGELGKASSGGRA